MMNEFRNEKIPRATLLRLATYLQVLEHMHKEGVQIVASGPLAKACEVNASQVRKDLTYFGEFGVRGVGYYVNYLVDAIKACLHVNRIWHACIVGVGNMGRALIQHQDFRSRGFQLVAAFDCDPFKIGENIYGLEVYCTKTLPEKIKEHNIEIAIIATPPERTQRVADQLIDAGIKGILNFSAMRIVTPDHVHVEYVDFFHQIYALTFNISNKTHELK